MDMLKENGVSLECRSGRRSSQGQSPTKKKKKEIKERQEDRHAHTAEITCQASIPNASPDIIVIVDLCPPFPTQIAFHQDYVVFEIMSDEYLP